MGKPAELAKSPPLHHTKLDLRHISARNSAHAQHALSMAQPPDALAFLREIRVAEFWRKQLGELEYSGRNPDDLYRWYEAMELRGPDEIRAYVEERAGRHPTMPVTGIVSVAPHPTRDIIDIWLASHDKVRTGHYWTSAAAMLVLCIWVVPTLHSCQDVHSPTLPQFWLPPAATVTAGTMNGPPLSAATMPTPPPLAPVNMASPMATAIAAQNGAGMLRSSSSAAGVGSAGPSVSTGNTSGPSLIPTTPTAAPTAAPSASFSSQGAQHH
jgi:hypothetical protein